MVLGVNEEARERDQQPKKIGHYRVLDVLGGGALTVVYRAESAGTGRVVVLKVLRSTAGAGSVFHRRFEREARLLAPLHHPNLIELYDYDAGVVGEQAPYMVLEHIRGASLAEVLKRLGDGTNATATGRLEADEAAAIALDVARALAYAHAQGVVHRDVKPGNVLLGQRTADGRGDGDREAGARQVVVKLVDFGIAQEGRPEAEAASADRTSSSSGSSGAQDEEGIGTPAYMSPEQLLGETVDHRSDQFALGLVLYQLLTGVRPFDGDDGRPAIQRVRRDPPRPFRSLSITVPRPLERLVLRCLSKRPGDRYDSTREIADELSQFLEERSPGRSTETSTLHARVLSRARLLDERRTLRTERIGHLDHLDRLDRTDRDEPRTADGEGRAQRTSPLRVRAVPLFPTVLGVALSFVAMAAGGAVIQWRAGGIRKGSGGTMGQSSVVSDVGAGEVGFLRVMVRPWAEVVVDGQKIDTTPFARAIRLRPGRHVVNFLHPLASERRLVDIRAGETTMVEVVLPVPVKAPEDEFLLGEPSAKVIPAPSSKDSSPFGVPSSLQGAPGSGGP